MPGIPLFTVQQYGTVISDLQRKIERSRTMIQHYEATIQLLGETPLRLRKIIEHETKIRAWSNKVQYLENVISQMTKYNRSLLEERNPSNG